MSCLQINHNVPVLPAAIFYEGIDINLLDLDANYIELGIAEDADGDFIEAELSVEPEQTSFKFTMVTGYLQFSFPSLLDASFEAG